MDLKPISEPQKREIELDFHQQYSGVHGHGIHSYGWQMMPYGQEALLVALTSSASWDELPVEFENVEVYYRKVRVKNTPLAQAISAYAASKMEVRMILIHGFLQKHQQPGMLGASVNIALDNTEYLAVQVLPTLDLNEMPQEFQGFKIIYQVVDTKELV